MTVSAAGHPLTVTTWAIVDSVYTVTVYDVTAEPPSQAGADQPTVANPGPGTAVTAAGGSGTSGETGPVTSMTLKYAAA
jgi:hypothetical protein